LEEAGFRAHLVDGISSLRRVPVEEGLAIDTEQRAESEKTVETEPLVIKVDLFG
jgi:hypothetical protein